MRPLSPGALRATPTRLIVRRAWWAYLPLIVFLGLGCAFWAALFWHAEAVIFRVPLLLVCAFVLALFLLVAARTAELLGDSNWLLRITHASLVLNPLDASGHSGGEPVELPFEEIVALRRVVEKRLMVGDHSIENVHDTHVYLELTLAAVDATPLAAFAPPITLKDARTVRVAWRDRATRLTPSLATFVRALPATIARHADVVDDWPESPTLSDDTFRERVRALCAGNDKIGAIKVVRVRYKMGLREAKELVEQIAAS